MGEGESRGKLKKAAIRFGLVFLIVLAVLTYFSKTIERVFMPEVTYVTPVKKVFNESYVFEGAVTYRDSYKRYPSIELVIDEVLVRPGQYLEKDTAVAKVDDGFMDRRYDEIEMALLQSKIIIEEYQIRLKKGDISDVDKMAYMEQLSIEEKRFKLLERESLALNEIIMNDYQIYSQVEGQLIEFSGEKHQYMTQTEVLFEYVGHTTYPVIQWTMNPEEAEIYDIHTKLKLEYYYLNENADSQQKASKKKVILEEITKTYMDETDKYLYSADLREVDEDIKSAYKIKATFTSNGVVVEKAIPISALFGKEGELYVYILNEDEEKRWTVQEYPVIKVHQTDTYCQINHLMDVNTRVVLSTSKPLSDDMQVKID